MHYQKIYELPLGSTGERLYRAGCDCGWIHDKDRDAKSTARTDWTRHAIRKDKEVDKTLSDKPARRDPQTGAKFGLVNPPKTEHWDPDGN